jgi:hypothetical protein
MHMRITLPLCLLLGLVASQASAQFRPRQPPPGEDYHVELGMRFWFPDPGIIIGSDSLSAVNPTGVDFVQEFGITKKKFNEFKGALRGGKHALRVARVDMVYNEAALLQRTIEFGGREFTVNALATAALEWDLWRVGYEYDFVKTDHGLFGLIAEVDFNHVVADLRATTGLNTVASLTDENVPTPGFGLIGRGYVHRNVSITAEFTGFKLPGFLADKLSDLAENAIEGDSKATMRDFDIYVTGSITRYFGIQGGYRWLTADYEIDRDLGDLSMKGPYFGAMVRF